MRAPSRPSPPLFPFWRPSNVGRSGGPRGEVIGGYRAAPRSPALSKEPGADPKLGFRAQHRLVYKSLGVGPLFGGQLDGV